MVILSFGFGVFAGIFLSVVAVGWVLVASEDPMDDEETWGHW